MWQDILEWIGKFIFNAVLYFFILPVILVLLVNLFREVIFGGVPGGVFVNNIGWYSYGAVIDFYVQAVQWLIAFPTKVLK